MKTCILILGMHRSGTSALASVLHHIGYGMGKDILLSSYDNPRGFFENEKVVHFNDKVLGEWGVNWDTPFVPILDDTSLESTDLVQEAKDILSSQFAREGHFIIKDPRLCYTFPIWHQALKGLHIHISCIINLREVTEIIASLESRNNFSAGKSFNLTCAYLLSAEYHTRSTPRHLLSYTQLLDKPTETIAAIIEKLNLPFRPVPNESYTFLSKDIKNHDLPDSKLTEGLGAHQQRWIHALQLISSMSNNKLDKGKLAQLDTHRADMSKAFTKLVDKTENEKRFYKVIFKKTESYTERGAIKGDVMLGSQHIAINDLKEYGALKGIKIILAHEPISVKVESLSIVYDHKDASYELSDNATKKLGHQLYFKDQFPQLIIAFDKTTVVNRLDIRLHYITFGNIAVSQLLEKNVPSHSSPLSAAFQALVTHPLRFLKGINKENIRVLRSALQRESPRTILRNLKKYLERDRALESSDILEVENKDQLLKTASKSTNKQIPLHILYITPYLPEYDTSSGGRRSSTYLSLLAKEHRVSIFCLGTIKKKYFRHLSDNGIHVLTERDFKSLVEILPFSHCVIYSRYYTYYEAQKARRLYPSAIHIIDSVDIHWLREERAISSPESLGRRKVEKNKKREIEAYNDADEAWVVSKEDKEALLLGCPSCSSAIVSNIHEVIVSEYHHPQNKNLLFLGGYNHHPNLAAVDILAKRIFPKVLNEVPDARLVIAGSNAPEEVISLGSGFVEEEALSNLYADTLMTVVPLLSGAGVKGKITEAITHMTPVLTNDIGNEGINLKHLVSGLVTNELDEMAALIINACQQKYDLASISYQAQRRLMEIAGPDKAISEATSSFYRPVDICIVTYNQLALLKEFLLTRSSFILTAAQMGHKSI